MAPWISAEVGSRGWYQAGDASQACHAAAHPGCAAGGKSLHCSNASLSQIPLWGSRKSLRALLSLQALLSPTSSCLLLLRCPWASAWLRVSEWAMPWEQGMWCKPRPPASLHCCAQVSAVLQSRRKGNYQQMVQFPSDRAGDPPHRNTISLVWTLWARQDPDSSFLLQAWCKGCDN